MWIPCLICVDASFVRQVPQLVADCAVKGSLYCLIAISFTLAYSLNKSFQFTLAAFITLGGYLTLACEEWLRLPPFVAVAVGLIIVAGLAISLQSALYSPLEERDPTRLVVILASIGAYTILQNLVSFFWGDELQIFPISNSSWLVFGAHVTTPRIAICITAGFCCICLYFLLERTTLGSEIRAVADDRDLANIFGIPVKNILQSVVIASSVIAAFAGVLIGYDEGLQPTMGFEPFLLGISAAILGGIGSVPGACCGAFLMSLVEVFGVWKLPTYWQRGLVFTVVCIVIAARELPRGRRRIF